ncbi:hypothetical protein ACA910_006722 [Epithemia clementina (nom. ined.)]
MNYFAVPKGYSNVRMVYDGTKSGLNSCLYAPWFYLPDLDGLVRMLEENYWCIDNDYGEMFLNFWIHPDLQKYSGIDLTSLYGRRPDKSLWIEAWTRCPMGQSPLPFATIQLTRRLKRIILGDPEDPSNVFQWSSVSLNLPGSESYRPGEPWIAKRRKDGRLAADAHDYVDDLRGTAPTMEDAWQVGSRIAKIASYHGIQDAARKQREQSTQPGVWAGVVCGTTPMRPYISITQTKWDRTKMEVARLRQELHTTHAPTSDGKIDHKTLEQVTGFLNHVAWAFPTIGIFLNGIYGTMNAWRPDRDEDEWMENWELQGGIPTPDTAPRRVRVVARMRFDVTALEKLTEAIAPPECLLCPNPRGACARYYFADALGAGFGRSGWSPGDAYVEVDYGAWGDKVAKTSSSNFRELGNIVKKLEEMDNQGRLTDLAEVFVFTDNYHAEAAFYCGTAKSPEVVALMLRLHVILMKGLLCFSSSRSDRNARTRACVDIG